MDLSREVSSDSLARLTEFAIVWSSQRQQSPAQVALEATQCLTPLGVLLEGVADGGDRQAVLALMQRANGQAEAILSAGDSLDGRFEWVDGSLTR